MCLRVSRWRGFSLQWPRPCWTATGRPSSAHRDSRVQRPVPSSARPVIELSAAFRPLSQPGFFGCRRGRRQWGRLQSPAWSSDSHPDAVPLMPRRRHAVAELCPAAGGGVDPKRAPSRPARPPSARRDCCASEATAVATKAAEFESGPAVSWVDGCHRFSLPGVLINKEQAAPAPLAACVVALRPPGRDRRLPLGGATPHRRYPGPHLGRRRYSPVERALALIGPA